MAACRHDEQQKCASPRPRKNDSRTRNAMGDGENSTDADFHDGMTAQLTNAGNAASYYRLLGWVKITGFNGAGEYCGRWLVHRKPVAGLHWNKSVVVDRSNDTPERASVISTDTRHRHVESY